MTIWFVMLTWPPMICPLTPPALLLPKSTRHGVYTNRLRLLNDVLFDTLKFGVGMGEAGHRPACHERTRNKVYGLAPVPWKVVLFAVENTVAVPLLSVVVPVQKTARLPFTLTDVCFP